MRGPLSLLLSIPLFCLVCPPTDAAMYRWVDENGTTIYSQSPPPGGDAVRIKQQAAPDPAETAAARERLGGRLEQSFDTEEAAKQAAQERAQADQQRLEREKNCAAARKNLQTLRDLGRRLVRTPDGKYQYLSDAQRDERMREAQEQIKDLCD